MGGCSPRFSLAVREASGARFETKDFFGTAKTGRLCSGGGCSCVSAGRCAGGQSAFTLCTQAARRQDHRAIAAVCCFRVQKLRRTSRELAHHWITSVHQGWKASREPPPAATLDRQPLAASLRDRLVRADRAGACGVVSLLPGRHAKLGCFGEGS